MVPTRRRLVLTNHNELVLTRPLCVCCHLLRATPFPGVYMRPAKNAKSSPGSPECGCAIAAPAGTLKTLNRLERPLFTRCS